MHDQSDDDLFALYQQSEVAFVATCFDPTRNGCDATVVDRRTLSVLLLGAIAGPGTFRAFAIDASGLCTLLDREDRTYVITPDCAGLYDLAVLVRSFGPVPPSAVAGEH